MIGLRGTYDFDSIGTEADNNFWTAYLLGAYQCDAQGDMDPGSEVGNDFSAFAATDDFNGQGSSMFWEMFSENGDTFAATEMRWSVGHEIGHLFFGDHTDGGLMATLDSPQRSHFFSPITLNRIRSVAHP